MSDETVVGFELKMIGRLSPAKSRSTPGNDTIVEGKRRDQERVRKDMAPYYDHMTLCMVHTFNTTKDENLKLRIWKEFGNRVLGLPKAVSEEERKGADSHSLLDVLAAFSGAQANLERGSAEAPAISHTPTIDDNSTVAFLDELERTRDGDIVDGELVDG